MAIPLPILNVQNFAIGCLIALVLGLGIGGGTIWYVKGLQITAIHAKAEADIAKMEAKVTTAESATTQAKLDFEVKLKDKSNELDLQYEKRTNDIDRAVAKLDGIKLRDPTANSNSGGTGNQGSAGGDIGSNPGTDLSLEASQFLFDLAGDADKTRERLIVCKAYNEELVTQMQNYHDEIEVLRKKFK